MTWRRALLAPALALSLLLPAPAAAQAVVSNETLVMPFDNATSEPRLFWLSEGSAVLVSELWERYGGTAVPRDERIHAFARLQLPSAASLSHATRIKVGQLVNASAMVLGSFELADTQLTVRARVLHLDAGRLEPDVVERGAIDDVFGIYDRVVRRLRDARSPAPTPSPGTLLTSPQAFEAYVKGLIAEAPARQRTYLTQAAQGAPADDRIKLALWQVHTDAGRHDEALSAAASVASTSLVSRAARYLVARSQIELKRYEEAFNTLTALQKEARSAEVMNALGVVQLRRGGTPQSGRAVYYFSQAAQAMPEDADYFFNLGYAYWFDKDAAAAVYWLKEAVRRDPADGDAHRVLAAALQQTGQGSEAARERLLAERLSAAYEGARAAGLAGDAVPRGLERVKPFLDRPNGRVNAVITSAEQRDQAQLALFHYEAARRAYDREADRVAEQELRRAIFLSPYMAPAHLLLGRLHLRGGRVAEAIQALNIASWSEPSVEAHLALAEAYLAVQNLPAARQAVERALAIDPTDAGARALHAKIGGRGPGPSPRQKSLE